jgi:uncharacterized SAM-binding protein YcdF (DUF218 family)
MFIAIISRITTNLFLWLWLVGAVVGWRGTKKQSRLRYVLVAVFLLLWTFGTRPVVEGCIGLLEGAYHAPSIEELREKKIRTVLVLTGGGYDNSGAMLSSALPYASMYRFIGGMEICDALGDDCTLVFSGSAGRGNSDVPTAEVMARLANRLNPDMKIMAESESDSTGEHPGKVKELIGDRAPFVLVTSAYHMRRSMNSFRKAGLDPIPWPVDYQARGNYSFWDIVPSFDGYWSLQLFLREVQALLFYAVGGG